VRIVYVRYFQKHIYPLMNGYYFMTSGKAFIADIYNPGNKVLVKDITDLTVENGYVFGKSSEEILKMMPFKERIKCSLSKYKDIGYKKTANRYWLDMKTGELFYPISEDDYRMFYKSKIKNPCLDKHTTILSLLIYGGKKPYWLNEEANGRCNEEDIYTEPWLDAIRRNRNKDRTPKQVPAS